MPLTNGSGSGRPKNLRIRIPNIGYHAAVCIYNVLTSEVALSLFLFCVFAVASGFFFFCVFLLRRLALSFLCLIWLLSLSIMFCLSVTSGSFSLSFVCLLALTSGSFFYIFAVPAGSFSYRISVISGFFFSLFAETFSYFSSLFVMTSGWVSLSLASSFCSLLYETFNHYYNIVKFARFEGKKSSFLTLILFVQDILPGRMDKNQLHRYSKVLESNIGNVYTTRSLPACTKEPEQLPLETCLSREPFRVIKNQCCRSWMFIPDPGS